jgi:hypothetical protein
VESHHRSLPGPGSDPRFAAADAERARELAAVEVRAAIAFVARDVNYRLLLCGMATDPRLLADLDEVATRAGVVLERRIRNGGGLDVVVRGRGDPPTR